ncbi:hypothetical protein AB0I81_00635 [Nonomuraea sp. NPDC050404]|uniref:winged helix-turn-helix transcriptional regulator n=1 Tax=Nonomuraea sp. NPDC050404 TaxID=3155783 RepID=UPI0033D1A848
MVMSGGSGKHDHHDVHAALCPCRDVLDLLANKWSAPAIGALEGGPRRFGELQRPMPVVGGLGLAGGIRLGELRSVAEEGAE